MTHREQYTIPHPTLPNPLNTTTHATELPTHTAAQCEQSTTSVRWLPTTWRLPCTEPTSKETEQNPHQMYGRRHMVRASHPPKHPSRSSIVQCPDHTVEHRICWTASEQDTTIPSLPRNYTCHIRRVLEVWHAWTHGPRLREPHPNPRF